MKKIMALLLALTMMLSLTACGGAGKGSQLSSSSGKSETSEKTNEDDSGEILVEDMPVVRMCFSVMSTGEDEELIEEEMNKLLAERYGIQIDIVKQLDNTQLNLMLTGGEDSIDIFTSFWFMSQSTLYGNGQLMNLEPYMEEQGAGILELFEPYPEILDSGRIDGDLYGLPAFTAWSTPYIYIAKEDVSEAAGIDWSQVHTLADATDAMIKMKEVSPTSYFIPGATQTYWVPKDLDDLGDTKYLGVILNPDENTTVENYYESSQFLDFMEQVKIWQEYDLISPDPMSNDDANLFNMQYGIVDGTPGYSWSIDEFCYESNIQQNLNGNVVGAQIGERYITTGTVQTYMWHVSSFAKNPEAAVTLLNALYTDTDLAFLLGYGLEEKHYVVDENGQLHYPEGKTGFDTDWGGVPMDFWPNTTECPTFWFQPEDKNKNMMETNKEAKRSLALGFVFDSSVVSDEYAACSSVVDQYYLPLINGAVDIDSILPEFQNALKNAGVDTIVAEKQAQLDAWLAEKES